jgi:glycosyltransferase involved in cell wall biosynthesis
MINVRGHIGLHFLFCGDGPDLEAFKALADKLQINDHLTFAGKRADIRSILPSCDIGMHCAEGEVGYSLSILEYMSAGLATIVPDRPSTRCATRDNDTGLLYRPRDLQSACSAITRCMDEDFRHRLSEAAAEDIMANYDIENTNKQLTTILDRIFR